MNSAASQLARSWRSSRFLSHRFYAGLWSYHSSSTATTSSSSSSTPSSANNSVSLLYDRVSSIAAHPRVSVVPILDRWILEGNKIDHKDLSILVNRLRNSRRYSQALQVSEWINRSHSKQSSSFSAKDISTHLFLVFKVRGLGAAKKYFKDLPLTSRTCVVFCVLLNCYASANKVRKAERLMKKMKKLGFDTISDPYNIMLKLYAQSAAYDKVKQLLEEMDNKGFVQNAFTYRVLLNAYSTSAKVGDMETVLMKMEGYPERIMRPSDYITAANGYLKAGILDKSLVMLKIAERLAKGKVQKHVYHYLLTMHARAQAKEEVFRIWQLYKGSFTTYNEGYRSMVSSLVILNDFEGAEKIIDEWVEAVSGNKDHDFGVISPLLRAYGKIGDFVRAEALINRVSERLGQEPLRETWAVLAIDYQMHNRMEDSVRTMKRALLTNRGKKWVISRACLRQCLGYIKMRGNLEELEEFKTLLGNCGFTVKNLCSGSLEDGKEKPNVDHEVEEDAKSSCSGSLEDGKEKPNVDHEVEDDAESDASIVSNAN